MTRKVCFIDNEGQVGTCIRDDEDCSACALNHPHNGDSAKDCAEPHNTPMVPGYRARCCGTCANRKSPAYMAQYGDREYCTISWAFKDRFGICEGNYVPDNGGARK